MSSREHRPRRRRSACASAVVSGAVSSTVQIWLSIEVVIAGGTLELGSAARVPGMKPLSVEMFADRTSREASSESNEVPSSQISGKR